HFVAFVKMCASTQDNDRRFAQVAKIQFARVAADGRFGEAGDFGVGNFFGYAQFRQHVMKAAAEHDGERRTQRRNFFESRGGGLGTELIHFEIAAFTSFLISSLSLRSARSIALSPKAFLRYKSAPRAIKSRTTSA